MINRSLPAYMVLTMSSVVLLIACGGGGGDDSSGTPPLTTTAPTLLISAVPSAIVIGQAAAVTWSTTGATSCTATGAWSGAQATAGSLQVTSLTTVPQSFALSCSGPGGSIDGSASLTASASAGMVAVPPPAVATSCAANCLYVNGISGDDSNDGKTPATAFKTMNRASSLVVPGSTVQVASGTYTSDGSVSPVEVSISGVATNWITFQAAPGSSPVIQIPDLGTNAEGGFHIAGASYIKIDGFEVIGTSKLITPQQAAFNDGTQAILNSDCVAIDGTGRFPGIKLVHDVIVTNMKLHDCAGGGVTAQGADALTITYNLIYGNGFWTVFDTSGIDLYHLTDAFGSGTQGAYKNIIVGNTIFGNHSNFPAIGFIPVEITDGNGLIIDDNMHIQPSTGSNYLQGAPYTGRTYIANNIAYDNGGRGVHVYESAHVDIVNNTAYNNMLTDSIIFGEIDAQSSADVNIVNNIAINLNNKMINFNDNNYAYSFNLWDGSNVPFRGSNDIAGAALLTDPPNANFVPAPLSPAVASGTTALSPTLDSAGRVRRSGHVDRGAIQLTP